MFFYPLHPSSNSVEIKSVLMSFIPLNIKPSTLNFILPFTFFNNKNGWNTFMCSSSTLMIKPSSAIHYPPEKWNTPVPLFPQKSPNFSSQTQIFNNLLTNLPSSSNSVEILMFLCLKLPSSSNSVETPSVLLFSQKKHRKFGYLPEKY